MKAKLYFSALVKQDIKEGFEWYNRINKKLGHSFLKDYKNSLVYISEFPEANQIRYENQRICFLKRFPMGVHYEYFFEKNEVMVYAVLHTSQNPDKWTKRG